MSEITSTLDTLQTVDLVDFPPAADQWDSVSFDPDLTYGAGVVGDAQAGKSFFCKELTSIWQYRFGRDTCAIVFSNSNAYRGTSLEILERSGLTLDEPVSKPLFREVLNSYIDSSFLDELPELLAGFYNDPAPVDRLRSPAVNSVVPITSGHVMIRPLVNTAGANFLTEQISEPEAHGLPGRLGFVATDARNQGECRDKFEIAGICDLGTFILTCPEEIIARRILGEDADAQSVQLEAERLRARNAEDRAHDLGRMTRPEDVEYPYVVDQAASDYELYYAGESAVLEPSSAIVIRTDRLSQAQERHALAPILAGMLNASSLVTLR